MGSMGLSAPVQTSARPAQDRRLQLQVKNLRGNAITPRQANAAYSRMNAPCRGSSSHGGAELMPMLVVGLNGLAINVQHAPNARPLQGGIEACGSAHHWARKLLAMSHTVRVIAPQFVKPYVKTNKNDAADVQAICEAVA